MPIPALIAGRRLDRWGMPSAESVDFYDAKGVAEAVLGRLRIEADVKEFLNDLQKHRLLYAREERKKTRSGLLSRLLARGKLG